MTRHAKESSARPNQRQASGPAVLRRGLTTFLLTAVAILLVPAAQAFGETPSLKLNIVGSGSGEVKSKTYPEFGIESGTPPIACSYDGTSQSGTCENAPDLLFAEEPPYAEQLFAEPAPGSELVGWTVERGAPGECPIGGAGSPSCQLYGEDGEGIEWEVGVEFKAIPFNLTLHTYGPSGAGTVTSAPAGIDCSTGEECAAELAGGTILTAHPASGYTIAGWIGCKQTGDPTSCSVEPNAEGEELEATAIFLKEGVEGKQGKEGKQGSAGEAGAQGPAGPKGDTGSAGAAGAQGPQGATGPQGPAGKVICKVKQKGKKVKVTCTVKQAKSSSSSRRLRWKLMRGKRTISHGNSRGALRLDLSRLRAGHYTLHAGGESTSIVVAPSSDRNRGAVR